MNAHPITTGEIRLMFEQWWILEGQYECASGQPKHKEVIFSAWLAGWDSLNRMQEVEAKIYPMFNALQNCARIGLAYCIALAGRADAAGEKSIVAQADEHAKLIRETLRQSSPVSTSQGGQYSQGAGDSDSSK